MVVPIVRLPEGTRVRVSQANLPLDPALIGRTGTIVFASEYQVGREYVALDGEDQPRVFRTEELEVIEALPLPPERQQAKLRPPLP